MASERAVLLVGHTCAACGDDYVVHTAHPQPGEYDPDTGETVSDEWVWAAREGDRVTCDECGHEAQILVAGEDAHVDEIGWCTCAWCVVCHRCGAREHVDCVCYGAEAHAGTCPAVTIGRRYSRTGRLLGVIAWAEPERCACTWPAVVREEVSS